MSVTFYIGSETIDLAQNGKTVIRYTMLYPDGFDTTPKVDPDLPELGEISPENPWSLNVNNRNAKMLLQLIMGHEVEVGEFNDGELTDIPKLIEACDNILASIRSIPELDEGTETVVDDNFIDCGRMKGYLQLQVPKLRELALAAQNKGAIIYYA